MRVLPLAISAFLLAAAIAPATAASPGAASTTLRDAAGKAVGTAAVTETADGLRIRIKAMAMPPGIHGVHLHAVGLCEAPEFKSAGGHWNPTMKMHGRDNPAGMHMGDIPNLTIGANGRGKLDARIPHAALTSGAMPLIDADGAAIVVHATADDYKTDPSGNSGARIACGVLTAG